jgi:hypothetical protein
VVLRFTTDYRSRAWNQRFAAGQVVDLDGPIVTECVAAGVASEVLAEPAPVVAERVALANTSTAFTATVTQGKRTVAPKGKK